MIPGAILSTGRYSSVTIGPLPSIGSPRAFTTRPRSASPTGTDMILPVLFTLEPSFISASEPSITAPTKSCSRLSAMHCTPLSNSRSSFIIQFSSPWIRTIPSPTVTTVPVSVRVIFESNALILDFIIPVISSGRNSIISSFLSSRFAGRIAYCISRSRCRYPT